MSTPAATLYARGSLLDFPALVVGGRVIAGAAAWFSWLGSAPVGELEQGNAQLDAFAARLRARVARHIEGIPTRDAEHDPIGEKYAALLDGGEAPANP
jgi:hypothetical protein